MLKLTFKNGGDMVIVNVRNIEYFFKGSTSTIIHMVSGNEVYVVDSPEEIAEMIKDKY